jgi:hypothetical protein
LPLRRHAVRLKEAAAGISRLWSVTPAPPPSPDRRARRAARH